MPPAPSRAAVLTLTALLLASPALAQEADLYAQTMARAAALGQEGRLFEAARALEGIAPLYPQDYALALALGFTYARAGRWADAERSYRDAFDLSGGSAEARLGLGLSLERQRRCPEARVILGEQAAEAPRDPEAVAALERCKERPAFKVDLDLSTTGQLYPDHPYKSLGIGGSLTGTITHESGLFLSSTYRGSHFVSPTTSTLAPWDQHEGYFTLGYNAPLFGLGLRYAVVSDGSGAFGTSHHVGATGRVSPYGDIVLDLSASLYADLTVLRSEVSWAIPITHGFSVIPAFAAQLAGGEPHTTGKATIAYAHPRFSLFAGGKYGAEVRPAYLDLPVVMDVGEEIKYGVFAGGSVNVGGGFRIHASYAMDRLERAATATDSGYSVNGYYLTLGTAASF
ncbi:MAG: hypothetical protein U0359_15800 [Byssovorax sp.]